MSIEMVHIYRGNQIESIHRGDAVALTTEGKLLFEYGNKDKRTFWRSSAKPFQIIPFIEAGGLERFDISAQELALMTSSHGGEEEHTKVLSSILNKLGKTFSDLDCGISRPMFEGEYKHLLKNNIPFSTAHNPCSGKHSSMLGLGVLKNISLKDYILPTHLIQQIMLTTIAAVTELAHHHIDIAIDGCGVPVFGMPLYNMALAYSKLAGPYSESTRILSTIANAMAQNPFYVAGSKRLDTIIMEETQGQILAKLGAESVYCMSVINQGIGIALKVEDGSYRALDCIVPHLLLKHHYISQEQHHNILKRLSLTVYNHRKQAVGQFICPL